MGPIDLLSPFPKRGALSFGPRGIDTLGGAAALTAVGRASLPVAFSRSRAGTPAPLLLSQNKLEGELPQ